MSPIKAPQSDQQKIAALKAAYAEFLRQINEIKKEETAIVKRALKKLDEQAIEKMRKQLNI